MSTLVMILIAFVCGVGMGALEVTMIVRDNWVEHNYED
jgi:hypothetical protein